VCEGEANGLAWAIKIIDRIAGYIGEQGVDCIAGEWGGGGGERASRGSASDLNSLTPHTDHLQRYKQKTLQENRKYRINHEKT
jgi:hypothetical protein